MSRYTPHPTAEEFNTLSDAALARWFRWYQDKDDVNPTGVDDLARDGILPHLGELIHFLQETDPQWVAAVSGNDEETVLRSIWERVRRVLETDTI